MFELVNNPHQNAVIKVVGVGGAGVNAIKHFTASHSVTEGLDLIAANTDTESLKHTDATTVLLLGESITNGLGAGSNPEVGRLAALENRDQIAQVLRGADMVFIIAGMGGGTGTGAAPVFAEVAKTMGILTIAIVTQPFSFEDSSRAQIATKGLKVLQQHVDSLITIPNENPSPGTETGNTSTLLESFKTVNELIFDTVKAIADLINRPGMINVDFSDIRVVMSESGESMVGFGSASGNSRAREAAEAAIRNSLLDDTKLKNARGVLVNITAGLDLSLGEFSEVGDTVEEFVSDNATVVVGTVIDPEISEEIRVTIIATGIDSEPDTYSINIKPIEEVGTRQNSITLITPTGTSDEKIAELIEHLSNVYRSVGGDQLEVFSVKNLPPDPTISIIPVKNKKRGNG